MYEESLISPVCDIINSLCFLVAHLSHEHQWFQLSCRNSTSTYLQPALVLIWWKCVESGLGTGAIAVGYAIISVNENQVEK